MIGTLKDLFRGRDGDWVLSVSTTSDPRAMFDELFGQIVNIDIKKHRNKRSLDANGFAWALIDKIAEKLRLSKAEVYRETIREIGGVSDIICVQDKALDRLVSGWEKNGLGWQAETFPSRIKGCTNVILYYGSSVYDSKQMSELISNLIRTAEENGIPTISDKEAQDLIGKWAKKRGENENVSEDEGSDVPP